MDEASFAKRFFSSRKDQRSSRPGFFRRMRKSQSGQAVVEYIIVVILAVSFTRFVFFNKEYGFQAMITKTMLNLGSFLEQNLKTGTKAGADGIESLDAFAGTSRWTN